MQIEVGPDGQPVDETMRSFVIRMRTHLSRNPRRSATEPKMREMLASMISSTRNFPAVAAEVLLTALLDARILVRRQKRLACATAVRRGGPEDRVRRFEEYVNSVADRCGLGEVATWRLKTLIRMLANVDSAHVVETRSGPGVLVPSAISLGRDEIEVTGAFVIMFDPMRASAPCFLTVGSRDIHVEWRELRYLVGSVDVHLDNPPRRTALLKDWRLFGSPASSDPFVGATSAVRNLLKNRAAIEAFVGEPLANRKWNALCKSLRPRGQAMRIASIRLTSMLDPVIRRVALRNPCATYESYSQIASGDASSFERRRQFSESYPIFTALLPEIDETVVKGEPVLPVLAKLTGLPIPHLKRLRGVHWQKLGGHARMLIEDVEGSTVYEVLKTIPVDRMPQSRRDWISLDHLSHWRGMVGIAQWRALITAASRNWEGYVDLAKADFWHALDDTANALQSVFSGAMPYYATPASRIVRERVILEVCGENFGLKRMKAFTNVWHKGEARRTALTSSFRRIVFEQEPASWDPLTPEGFASSSGSMTWLLNEDELAREGQEMNHCVGSYWSYCARGESHIAQVFAKDGSRSTVEFRIDPDGTLAMAQHHTYRDAKPSPSCTAVVRAFLKAQSGRTFDIVPGKGRQGYVQDTRPKPLPPEMIEQLVEAYSDCVSVEFLRSLSDGVFVTNG